MANTQGFKIMLFVLCLMFAVPSMAKNNDLNEKIAVLGGGPAGIFAARKLVEKGYTKVTVFEKESVNNFGTIRSVEVAPGLVTDVTAKFVPSAWIQTGLGTYPPLQSLFDLTDTMLVTDAASPSYLFLAPDADAPFFFPGPPFFNGLTGEQIIGDLIWGWGVLEALALTNTNEECRAVLTLPSDGSLTAAEWSELVRKPAFTKLCAYSSDAFLGGPSVDNDVCKFLTVRTFFTPQDIAGVLTVAGIYKNSTLPLPPTLRSLLEEDVRRKNVAGGYGGFLTRLHERSDFDYLNDAAVSNVVFKNNGKLLLNFADNRKEKSFDKVIMAVRPNVAASILPDSHPAVDLMQQTFATQVFSQVVSVTGSSALFEDEEAFATTLYPQSFLLGTSDAQDSGVCAIFRETSLVSNLVGGIGYVSQTVDFDEETDLANILGSIGFNVQETIFSERFAYPVALPTESIDAGWYDQIDATQGESNVFLVGEAIAGEGIPMVLKQAINLVDKYF